MVLTGREYERELRERLVDVFGRKLVSYTTGSGAKLDNADLVITAIPMRIECKCISKKRLYISGTWISKLNRQSRSRAEAYTFAYNNEVGEFFVIPYIDAKDIGVNLKDTIEISDTKTDNISIGESELTKIKMGTICIYNRSCSDKFVVISSAKFFDTLRRLA